MTKIAIVGLGEIADVHTAAWEHLPGIQLVGGVEIGAVGGWTFRGRSIPVYDTIRELASLKPEYVVVATPSPTHYSVILEILATLDTRVLVEKPLASKIEHAEELFKRKELKSGHVTVLYHEAYAPEVQWAAGQLQRWLDELGPLVWFDSFFSDARKTNPDLATRTYVSSWIDTGINCLSVLARLVSLEGFSTFRRIGGEVSSYEACVQFSSGSGRHRGHVKTSWDVKAPRKHTTLAFGVKGARLELDHQAMAGRLMNARGETIELYQFEDPMPRLVAQYISLYETVLMKPMEYSFGLEENRVLHRLLLCPEGRPPN